MLLPSYIKNHGLKIKDFARNLGITREHLRKIIIGKHFPSRKLAMRIQDITNNEVSKVEAIFPEDFN